MAQKRMFSLQIIDTDLFLEMPATTQNLYFHLGMRADDDGFVSNPKKIMKIVGCGDDDLKVLLTKKFIIGFESGIIVIKHWKIHNCIQKDRYKETIYIDEKEQLFLKKNNMYTDCKQDGNTDQIRSDQIRSDQIRLEDKRNKKFNPPTPKEVQNYLDEKGITYFTGQYFCDHYETNDWMRGKNKIKNWKACVRTWKNKNQMKSEQEQIEEIQARAEYFRQIGESQDV